MKNEQIGVVVRGGDGKLYREIKEAIAKGPLVMTAPPKFFEVEVYFPSEWPAVFRAVAMNRRFFLWAFKDDHAVGFSIL